MRSVLYLHDSLLSLLTVLNFSYSACEEQFIDFSAPVL